ncbi:MAG TPA: iron ABC transporter permease [Stellaceae bacterium]|jgi:iron(III) transport system permease protein
MTAQADALPAAPPARSGTALLWLRIPVLIGVALAVLVPIGLVVYQSFLSAPFFDKAAAFSLSAYEFVLTDPDFHDAFLTTLIVAVGMAAIAVPLGAVLAFLVARTDLPGKGWLEPLILVPIFLSAIVVAFGYVVALGPVGFVSLAVKSLLGFIPWRIYSLPGLVVIAGLSHVPHVYLYASSALRGVNPEVEEAARTMGAPPWRVALQVSLPLIWPSLVYSGALVFFLGFELFGLPLILGDPAGLIVLTTYLYKLTNLLGSPSYQLMAVVVVAIVIVTLPLVYLQRVLLRASAKYVTLRGKGAAPRILPLGRWRYAALAIVLAWLLVTVVVPLLGVLLRAFVDRWGEGVNLLDVLTTRHFAELVQYPNVVRGIVNTLLIGVIGGALSVGAYALVALAAHRWQSRWAAAIDYLVLLPRALPGLIAGLAVLWVFLFVPVLQPLRSTLVSLWLAYTVVWLAFGLRLISAALLQIGPELEEAARVIGARPWRVARDVTLPLIRFGLVSSWLLCFMMFVREYSTGVYLLGPGTEVIGSLIVSLFGTGALDLIAALSVVNVVLIGAGLALALRFGVRLHG